ncbi:DUF58 domain-containing protein [Actomonas aquatica]|uniref:DUF58 domain-containing protein n=1 Tax=Actomonas aquatica TaxID=2866162 RepID=A0ABZ1C5H6_9BACT|nr:DUF58 domain-containing protein [Opitutus sp. WL0086]WRQ86602.1 DUF58 domain-containing protein [Opitutus sp. WL0086]
MIEPVHSPQPEGPQSSVVPGRRLLAGVAVVALYALLCAAWDELAGTWLLALGGWLLVALVDLAWSLQTVKTPELSVAEVVRFTKDRAGTLRVHLARREGTPDRLRFALALPGGFTDERDEVMLTLPEEAKSHVDWKATPAARGRFYGVRAACELRSCWGFWELRERRVLPCELRVYPDLLKERAVMAAMFLDRGQFGQKVTRTIGRGREFEKLREYQPGDGFDEIHWKATAKQGYPVTKVFQAERTQEIYVVLDTSRLSARPVQMDGITTTVLERYLTSALVLLQAAQRQGDRFGLVAYGSRVRAFLRAGNGAAHYGACREAVHTLQPVPETPDPAEIVRFLRTRLRRRALLFFLTDLSDPVLAEEFARHIGPLARQHLVMINQVRPPGVQPLFAGEAVTETAEVYQRLAGHLRWSELRKVSQLLRPQGATVAMMDDEALAGHLVTQYLEVKRRQAL